MKALVIVFAVAHFTGTFQVIKTTTDVVYRCQYFADGEYFWKYKDHFCPLTIEDE